MGTINFESSFVYLLPGIALAAGATYLIYSKKASWSAAINKMLAVIRFVLGVVLVILLLNPLLKQISTDVEQPRVVLAIDNSLSMTNGMDSLGLAGVIDNLSLFRRSVEEQGYQLEIKTLSDKIDNLSEIKFSEESTNLHSWFRQLQADYEGINLAEVFLISDGIYNQGGSPAHFPYPFKISAIGVGDTLQKEDVVLKQVLHNKIAYQGNRFPIVAEVVNHGFVGQQSVVEVRQGGLVVDQQNVVFNKPNDVQRIELDVEAKQSGFQRLTVSVRPLSNEVVQENNRQTVFIDVVDGKQKILMLAPSPHPDLKALAAVIDNNQNFELVYHIPGMNTYKEDKYDLAIVHQSYDRLNRMQPVVNMLKEKNIPIFHILGRSSVLSKANAAEDHVMVRQHRNQQDQAVGVLNTLFNKFTLPNVSGQTLSSFPPVTVPFGEYQIGPAADVLLYQKIGSVATSRPLLYSVEANGTKSAFMLADGFWTWRMQEYALTDDTETFDEIFGKLIQYLSTKVDKRKFRFYPGQQEYFANQTVEFHVELYNEIFERIYGEEVSVKITNESGEVQEATFVPVSAYSHLEMAGFEEGTYKYQASVQLGNKRETVRGEFIVKEMQLENIDQVANFEVLRRLASNSGGNFYTLDQMPDAIHAVDQMDVKGVIHTFEDIQPLLNIRWIFALLLLLASIEWFTRKYSGGY